MVSPESPTSTVPAAPHRKRAWLRPALLLAAILSVAGLAATLDLGAQWEAGRAWIEGLGALGPWLFALLFALATVAAVPATFLTLAAGALFGSLVGIATVSLGSTTGAAAAFLIGRWFARDAVRSWLAGNERFARLDRLTADHGAAVVAILRILPILPFNVLNYALGLTRVRFGTYVFWSFLTMLPGTALYVVGGDALTRWVTEGRFPGAILGVFAALGVSLIVASHRARRFLRQHETNPPAEGRPPRRE
ncbi:MAG: TVP38/TMEM64 family protein [Thermoanaerobaculia bacterium]|nr:TVP38/TMEM64 family protein [Thermoanaerobaculia bacterium]